MTDPTAYPPAMPGPAADEAARPKRRWIVFAVAGVIAVGSLVAALLLVLRETDDDIVSPAVEAPSTSDLAAVEIYQDLPTTHIDDKDLEYDVTPPVGGEHDPEWLACGAYDEPLRDENAVHNLEHGAVWITYDPAANLSEAELDFLESALPDDGIMSPYPGLPAPVVVTVWGAQLALEDPADPRLPMFLDQYGDGSTSPEPFASCEGGLSDPQGGTTALT